MRILCITITAVLLAGCGESGPPYAELLQIYNEEVKSLESLKRQREEIMVECKADIDAKANDLIGKIDALSKTADVLSRLDPREGLAAQKSVAEHMRQARITLDDYTATRIETRDRELAALDQRIDEQTARVADAEKKKDEAYDGG